MPYIAYTTMWAEGTVVAHTDDKEFAIGYDAVTGNIIYAKSYDELKNTPSFRIMAEFDSPQYIKNFNTSLYPRRK